MDRTFTKPRQVPEVTIERVEPEHAGAFGVFGISMNDAWDEQPTPEILEAEIAEAIRGVLRKHSQQVT